MPTQPEEDRCPLHWAVARHQDRAIRLSRKCYLIGQITIRVHLRPRAHNALSFPGLFFESVAHILNLRSSEWYDLASPCIDVNRTHAHCSFALAKLDAHAPDGQVVRYEDG